jgi:hypothetical protein
MIPPVHTGRSIMDDKWEKIAALDLKSVRQKFASKKTYWWHLGHSTDRLEREYRQFLYLIVVNPEMTVVPWSRDLDDFWHEHILDTEKYAQDCSATLGRFIHHNPHLPMGSSAHGEALAATILRYRAAFGESAGKGRMRAKGDIGCGAQMPVVFCAGGASAAHHHASGHHASGHHGGAGHSAGHGCGGHGGGHGCGGHGCGGHGGH